MALLIAPILFIGAVLYIAYPLLTEGEVDQAPEEETRHRRKALQEKEEIIETLKDIDMDFRMGKLSTQDYHSLKSDFEQRAVEVFQRVQALSAKGGKIRKKKSS